MKHETFTGSFIFHLIPHKFSVSTGVQIQYNEKGRNSMKPLANKTITNKVGHIVWRINLFSVKN